MSRNTLLLLTLGYAFSRLLLYLAGLRFVLMLDFMHFLDPELLKNDLWNSLVYLHVFPPLMNALIGMGLKIAGEGSILFFQGVFLVLGWGHSLAFAYLLWATGIRGWWPVIWAILFMMTPPFLYFEHFFFHTFPAASLVTISVALFHRALIRKKTRIWMAFFFILALLCGLRSTFHLVWLVFLIGLALLFSWPERRSVLAGALPALVLVLALYGKNAVLFGFFGSSSWFGLNLAHQTVYQMKWEEKQAWVEQGKLSRLSGDWYFNNLNGLGAFFDLAQNRGVPSLDQVVKSTGSFNYNHWAYLEASRIYAKDARVVLREKPEVYWKTVGLAIADFFRPSTRWHPKDRENSPFKTNREILEPYENAFNRLGHTFPRSPFGWYLILPVLIGMVCFQSGRKLIKNRLSDAPQEKTLLLMVTTIFYVTSVTCLLSIGELERMRFMVEGLILILFLSVTGRLIPARAFR